MAPAIDFAVGHRRCNRWRDLPSSFGCINTVGKLGDVASYVVGEVRRLPSFLDEDASRAQAYLAFQEAPYHEEACAYLADTCKEHKDITDTWPQLPPIEKSTSASPQKDSWPSSGL